jgi:hypothetical protein
LKAFLASLFEGLVVEGFVESGMTGAFRVSLVCGTEETVLSPYGFVDTPSRRATLAAAIASHF